MQANPLHPHASASNLIELLQLRSSATPDLTEFIFLQAGEAEESTLTAGAIDTQARAIGAWLQQQQAGGQPVLLACPTCPEFVTGFFGCLYAGAVPVPVPPLTGRRLLPRVAAIAEHSGAVLGLTITAGIRALAGQPALQQVRWQQIEGIAPALGAAWQPYPVTPDTIALLQYTSGSTAQPKGVMLSHANLLANAAQISAACGLSAADTGVCWIPLHHDMGLIGTILEMIYLHGIEGPPPGRADGVSVLMSPTAFTEHPIRWLEAISRYGSAISTAPDFAYRLCTERIFAEERARLDLSSWRVALCGGEPVRPATLERFARAFAESGFRAASFRPTYGLAEAALMVSVGRWPGAADPAVVSCGAPVAGAEVRIVDPVSGTNVAPGQSGEIWVRGPNVAQGYWQDAAATAAAFHAVLNDTGESPFLRTGDLGWLQAGELFIVGRLKDLILVAGENYYPEDIEGAVIEDEAVAAAAAFAVDRGERQEVVLLLERRRDWRRGGDAAALEALAQRTQRAVGQAIGLAVDAVVILRPAALPRTSSGKLQRQHYAALYLADSLPGVEYRFHPPALHAPVGSGADEQAEPAWVLAWLAEQINMDVTKLDLEQTFSSLGLGSLQTALLLARLETHLGIVVPLSQLKADAPLGELVTLIVTAMLARPASAPDHYRRRPHHPLTSETPIPVTKS